MARLVRGAPLLLCLLGCAPDRASDGGDGETEGDSDGDGDGDADGDGDGDGDGDDALPDIDLDRYCASIESPALAAIGPAKTAGHFGPCGHLAFSPADQPVGTLSLIHLDGSIEQPIATAFNSLRFSPGGGLLAVYDGEQLRVMDLHRDTTTTTVGSPTYGFVRTAHAEQPEQLWTCTQTDGLKLVRLDEVHDLATDVLCESVVGAGGSTRVLFADNAGVVTVGDADAHELWPTSSADFDTASIDGWPRIDTLEISHDGRLALHEVKYLDESGDAPVEESVEDRVLELDGGQLLETCGDALIMQAARQHAPAFVVCDDRALVWLDGALQLIDDDLANGEPRSAWLAESEGGLFFSRNPGALELLRASSETPTSPELLGTFATGELRPTIGKLGDVVVVGENTNTCAIEGCDPNSSVTTWALHRWTASAGLEGPLVHLHGSSWGIVELFEDGAVLLWGAPVEDPPLQVAPERRLLYIAADGELVFDSPLTDWFFESWSLADGRVLLEVDDDGQPQTDQLLFFDREIPGLAPLIGPSSLTAKVDERGRRVAFAQWVDDQQILHWGTLPGL